MKIDVYGKPGCAKCESTKTKLSHFLKKWQVADRVTLGPGAADVPATPLSPIPFHALRGPAVSAVVAWNGLRDRLGA